MTRGDDAYFDTATEVLHFHSVIRENQIPTHLFDRLQLFFHGVTALRHAEIERNAVSVDDPVDGKRDERQQLGTQEIRQSVGLCL